MECAFHAQNSSFYKPIVNDLDADNELSRSFDKKNTSIALFIYANLVAFAIIPTDFGAMAFGLR